MTTSSYKQSRLYKFWDSDFIYAFRHSWVAVLSSVIAIMMIMAAVFAPYLAPQNPFDPMSLDIMNSILPPAWDAEGDPQFLLGTDDQGRDILSSILYGARISLFVGFVAVLLSAFIGISAGLISGYVGGRVDSIIMRIADIQLSFPAILVALLIDGLTRNIIPGALHNQIALLVIILAISLSGWVQYARTVRASVMTERTKEYVQACHVMGLGHVQIMLKHILPNVMGPVLVIATINLALAIIIEATLSFLGVGVPPTTPSLGTLIRIGNQYLFSGEWWITFFPGLALVLLALSVNLFGDWLRDTLNPKLET